MSRTRLIAATAAVLLVAALPARAWAGWKEGKAAFDAGRYEEALAEFRAGAEADPDSAPWQFMLGSSLLRLGRAGEAVPMLERAVALDAGSVQYAMGLAQAQVAAGDPAAAVATLGGRDPAAVDQRLAGPFGDLLASAALRATDTAAARRPLERWVAAHPGSASPWLALGVSRAAAGAAEPAFEAYARAFELAPGDTAAGRKAVATGFKLAQASADEAGRRRWYGKAAPIAERLADAEPSADTDLLAGEAWLGAGRFETARGRFEAAAEAAPDDPLPRFYLARCALATQDGAAALPHLDRATRLAGAAGGDPGLRREIQGLEGYAYALLGEYLKAEQSYRAAGQSDRAAEMAAARQAARQNSEFEAERQRCLERIGDLEAGRAELEELGAAAEVRLVDRRLADTRQECAPYLGTS